MKQKIIINADTVEISGPFFNCRDRRAPRNQRRHKVITSDGICVLCGARGVTDARQRPPQSPTPDPERLDLDPDTDAVTGDAAT